MTAKVPVKPAMAGHKRKKITVFDCAMVALMLVFATVFIYPLWTIVVAAFSDPLEYVKNPLMLFPRNITFYNFKNLMTSANVWMGYRNTIIYAAAGTAINVAMTFVMAYALSMNGLPYRRVFNFFIVVTMFFSGGMIPGYLNVKGFGMLDTMWALVIPGAIGTYNLMITRTYLTQQIPEGLGRGGGGRRRRRASHVFADRHAAFQADSGGYHALLRIRPLEFLHVRPAVSFRSREIPAAADFA